MQIIFKYANISFTFTANEGLNSSIHGMPYYIYISYELLTSSSAITERPHCSVG